MMKCLYSVDMMLFTKEKRSLVKQALVFYRTRVYQMQPRYGKNWHSSVGKYVHHNRKTAKIRLCTSLKSISISGIVDTRDTVNADYF